MTGMAQVYGHRTMSPDDKNALDLWYIQNGSLWLDVKIALRTVLVFVRGERIDSRMLRTAQKAGGQVYRKHATDQVALSQNKPGDVLHPVS